MTDTETTLDEVEVLTEAAAAVDAAAASEGTPLPVIKVLKGNPTDVEVAALVAVLVAAAGAGAEPVDTTPPDHWGEPTKMHRGRAPFSPYSFLNRA
ncbi:acyl-CoA carboxylase epsilon subunit [Rhodococcus sp. NPDC003318]|uniref:acyl-CoA carboxylase epsilon subunit n=1 Tax=Rhodococcus sp. NPDC003318 TaxID=3364503 RepID=UPI0036D0D52B